MMTGKKIQRGVPSSWQKAGGKVPRKRKKKREETRTSGRQQLSKADRFSKRTTETLHPSRGPAGGKAGGVNKEIFSKRCLCTNDVASDRNQTRRKLRGTILKRKSHSRTAIRKEGAALSDRCGPLTSEDGARKGNETRISRL